jgi:EmrB/QacA subfamily drug resistance transporter
VRGVAGGKRSRPNLTLAALSLGGLSYSLLSSLVLPALPSIQRDLHASETGVAWLLTGFLLSASVATSIIGRLGDMYGKERVLLYTLMMLVGGTLLGALASTLPLLIVSRLIQGAGGGIFPLAFGIIRDEFPRERIAGSIGLMSAILGIGGAAGIVLAGLIVEHLSYHWLFWMPMPAVVLAAVATWRYVPESPIRVPGRINWLAGALMSAGIAAILVGISQTTVWGWGSPKTIALLLLGGLICCAWIAVELHSREPLIDMEMMRIRGVWTVNTAAFLLGAGMYSSFVLFPELAQLPKSTGFGFGAQPIVAGLYLLPSAAGMIVFGTLAGRISHRYGSKAALTAGTAITAASYVWLTFAHSHPYDILLASLFLGTGVALAWAALGNLIVQAVPPQQTGVATGMNTVMRALGGALGGQLSATLIADNTVHGLPTVTGFTASFVLATAFLIVGVVSSLLVPGDRPVRREAAPEAVPEGA